MSEIKDDIIKNHLLESKGSMKIFGKNYPDNSMFKDVTIEISNDKKYPIMVNLTDTGLVINLVRQQ